MKKIFAMSIPFWVERVFMSLTLFSVAFLFVLCAAERESIKHEFEIIELKEYYDGKGAIIPATSSQYPVREPGIEKVTLTREQARSAESILREDLYNYYKKFFDDGRFYYWQTSHGKEDTLKLFDEDVAKIRQRLRGYYRYYVGFVNNKNEEMVDIYLFEFSQEYANWKDEYIFGSEENDRGCYHINLTKKGIEYERE